jgi:hypothetical protein
MGLALSGGKWEINFYFAAIALLLFTGPLAVVLGFILCLMGLAGWFEFTAELTGFRFVLAGASPGLCLAVSGLVFPAIVLHSKTFETIVTKAMSPSSLHGSGERDTTPRGRTETDAINTIE